MRHQAPVAVSEHVGHGGQCDEAGHILRRAAQQPPATLGIQRPDSGRDVLRNRRGYSEATGSREVASSGTETADELKTKLPRVSTGGVCELLRGQRIETAQPSPSTPQNQFNDSDSSHSTSRPAVPVRLCSAANRLMPAHTLSGAYSRGKVPKVLVFSRDRKVKNVLRNSTDESWRVLVAMHSESKLLS